MCVIESKLIGLLVWAAAAAAATKAACNNTILALPPSDSPDRLARVLGVAIKCRGSKELTGSSVLLSRKSAFDLIRMQDRHLQWQRR